MSKKTKSLSDRMIIIIKTLGEIYRLYGYDFEIKLRDPYPIDIAEVEELFQKSSLDTSKLKRK